MFRSVPVAILSLFAASSGVRAGPLYMATMTGKIDFVRDGDGYAGVFADVVFVGDRFEQTYIFDDIPDQEYGTRTWYDIESTTLRIGQVAFQHSGTHAAIVVYNDPLDQGDSYITYASFTYAANGKAYPGGISLGDTTSTVFSDTSVPLSIDLNRFDVNYFSVDWHGPFVPPRPAFISGHVDSLTIHVIPEPSTVVLLGIGWAMMRRRNRGAAA